MNGEFIIIAMILAAAMLILLIAKLASFFGDSLRLPVPFAIKWIMLAATRNTVVAGRSFAAII